MELYQLRYFAAIAAHEHLLRAAGDLHVSPPALSRALRLLEEELGVPLFARVGRNLRLTEAGARFAVRVRDLLGGVADAVATVREGADVPVTIAGREVLLAAYAPAAVDLVGGADGRAVAALDPCAGDEAIRRARDGAADLVVCVQSLPPDFHGRVVDTLKSVTCVAKGHPLYAAARRGRAVPIDEVLAHDFACPSEPIGGAGKGWVAPDGWRDDVLPRRRRFTTDSLHVLVALVASGRCLAYLPSLVVGGNSGLVALTVGGCPYECRWTVRLGAPRASRRPWVRRVFERSA